MTITTTRDTTHVPTAPRQAGGVSLRGVLRSEAVKLRSLRSSWTTLASAALAMLVVGLIFAATIGGVIGGTGEDVDGIGPTEATLQGMMLAQLIVGVLGVLTMTSEYATGTIRTTLAMVPSRLPVLWAKAAVVAAVTFPLMLLASLGAFVGGQALIANGDMATASLGDPGVLRAVVGAAGYLTAVALAGLAIGTLLRATAASIATLFGAVFLLPGLGGVLLPAAWRDDVLQYLPSNAGTAITTVDSGAGLLSPGAGLLVLLAWVVVPLVLAARALRRRSV